MPSAPVRCVSIHRLAGGGVPRDTPGEEVAMALCAYGLDFDRQLTEMRGLFADLGFADTKVAVTELMSFTRRPRGPFTSSRHAEVMYFTGMMNACIRHRDFVELVTRTAVVNHGGGRSKVFEVAFPEPVHFLSKVYAGIGGCWPVACEVVAPGYSVDLRGLPRLEGVPVLECMALLDDSGKELTLLVTNRDARKPHAAKIRVAGFRPSPKARTRTIAGPPDEVNVWFEPLRVKIVESEIDAAAAFDYTFPPLSVTEVALVKARI